jgi:hypothetical protein
VRACELTAGPLLLLSAVGHGVSLETTPRGTGCGLMRPVERSVT